MVSNTAMKKVPQSLTIWVAVAYKIDAGASILGLFVMGSLVSKWTSINIPLELSRYKNQMGEEVVTTVQSVLNDLLPGLAALGLTFLCMYLCVKKSTLCTSSSPYSAWYFRLSFWCVSIILWYCLPSFS